MSGRPLDREGFDRLALATPINASVSSVKHPSHGPPAESGEQRRLLEGGARLAGQYVPQPPGRRPGCALAKLPGPAGPRSRPSDRPTLRCRRAEAGVAGAVHQGKENRLVEVWVD